MVKMFYSYSDGGIYVLHERCPLDVLMKEHTGGDGLLIYANKDMFEIVEYIDGIESGFRTRLMPKVKKPLSGCMCDMDARINDFFDYIGIVTEEQC